jgi:D-galactarolactone cycloisomerase
MKITAVKTFLLEHPMQRATGPSNTYYRIRRTLLIKLETDAGLCGWGETAAFGGIRSLIDETYAPVLLGQDPLAHRSLWRQLWGANFGNGMALGGIDIALDDLRGKALGISVAGLYGGRLRDRVLMYASTMNYVEGEDPAVNNPREAAARVAQGFRALKMRLGGQSHERDLAAATAVRRTVGPDVMLMADGNGAYTLGTAIKMGRALEELDFAWWEEPLPQETPAYPAYEVLTASLDIPIAAGEALASRGEFREAISRRAMDIVQPDASLAGGIGECLFVAEMAALWGIPAMPHCWGGAIIVAATAHLVSLLPDASWSRATQEPMVEYDLVENPFRDELLVRPLELKDGRISVPTGPGLGIEIDERVLQRYAKK